MGNLKDKGKFTSRKQLKNGESISCIFLYYDTRVNLICHVCVKNYQQKCVQDHFDTRGINPVHVETDKSLSVIACCD